VPSAHAKSGRLMRQAVADIFPAFTKTYEGYVPFLYLDVKGLVTCGCGNLVDPVQYAMGLPWLIDGDPTNPADDAAILQAWQDVKARQDLAQAGGVAFAGVTHLRLTSAAIDALVRSKCNSNESALAQRIPNWTQLPASAQLATLSLAWACGPWFAFPKFLAALKACDWATCGLECQMDATGNPGLVPRNRAQAKLFGACAQGFDPDAVAWNA
jgi:GH24 family phage-related lysozyme (muramidase)